MDSSFYIDDSWLILKSGKVNRLGSNSGVTDAFPMRNYSFVTRNELQSLSDNAYDPELAAILSSTVKVTDIDKAAFKEQNILPFLYPAVKSWLLGTDIQNPHQMAKYILKSLKNINPAFPKFEIHDSLLFTGVVPNKKMASHWYAHETCDFWNIQETLLSKDWKLRKVFETNLALAVPRYHIDYLRFEDGEPFFGILCNFGFFNLPVIKSNNISTWVAFVPNTNMPFMVLKAFIGKQKEETNLYKKYNKYWDVAKNQKSYVSFMEELYPEVKANYVVYQDLGVINTEVGSFIESTSYVEWKEFRGYLSKTDIYSFVWDSASCYSYDDYKKSLFKKESYNV